MKKTIQSRILLIIIVAVTLMGLVGSLSLYYFSTISENMDQIIKGDITAVRSAETIKGLMIDLRRLERVYIGNLRAGRASDNFGKAFLELDGKIQQYRALYETSENAEELKRLVTLNKKGAELVQNISLGDKLKSEKAIQEFENTIGDLTSEMRKIVYARLSYRYGELELHRGDIDLMISNAHRNMLFFLVLCLAGGAVLVVLAPRRVTAPFKRYIAAINEVEDLKFETTLPVQGYEEIRQLGQSINRLIKRFREFDEIKRKRIQFERRKQRVLANMVDLGAMMLTIEGDIIFLNAQLAKILNLNTESYQNKDYHLVPLPEDLKDMIGEILEKKERIDSRMMILNYREKGNKEEMNVEVNVDAGLVRNYMGNVANVVVTFEDITNPAGQSVFKRISFKEQEEVA